MAMVVDISDEPTPSKVLTPSEERAEVVHRLSTLLTAAFAYCGPLRDEIHLLKGGRQPALDILHEMETCLRLSVEMFPDLRRVI